MSMRATIWFDLPFVPDTEGRKFQNLLESRVQQNDREYILGFLSNLPDVRMYISETIRPDKEPPA
jgi:hypothetical protein